MTGEADSQSGHRPALKMEVKAERDGKKPRIATEKGFVSHHANDVKVDFMKIEKLEIKGQKLPEFDKIKSEKMKSEDEKTKAEIKMEMKEAKPDCKSDVKIEAGMLEGETSSSRDRDSGGDVPSMNVQNEAKPFRITDSGTILRYLSTPDF